jgi:hypothetical protein
MDPPSPELSVAKIFSAISGRTRHPDVLQIYRDFAGWCEYYGVKQKQLTPNWPLQCQQAFFAITENTHDGLAQTHSLVHSTEQP